MKWKMMSKMNQVINSIMIIIMVCPIDGSSGKVNSAGGTNVAIVNTTAIHIFIFINYIAHAGAASASWKIRFFLYIDIIALERHTGSFKQKLFQVSSIFHQHEYVDKKVGSKNLRIVLHGIEEGKRRKEQDLKFIDDLGILVRKKGS